MKIYKQLNYTLDFLKSKYDKLKLTARYNTKLMNNIQYTLKKFNYIYTQLIYIADKDYDVKVLTGWVEKHISYIINTTENLIAIDRTLDNQNKELMQFFKQA